jgi:hypothetical protein
MADELTVVALVRKRAELAGRIGHVRAELDGMLASLAALDATLRLFDPAIRVESIRPKAHRPANGHPSPGIETRDVLGALREAAGPLSAREIASRLLAQAGREADEATLRRAAEAVGRALRRQRRKGTTACDQGTGQEVIWRLMGRQ